MEKLCLVTKWLLFKFRKELSKTMTLRSNKIGYGISSRALKVLLQLSMLEYLVTMVANNEFYFHVYIFRSWCICKAIYSSVLRHHSVFYLKNGQIRYTLGSNLWKSCLLNNSYRFLNVDQWKFFLRNYRGSLRNHTINLILLIPFFI